MLRYITMLALMCFGVNLLAFQPEDYIKNPLLNERAQSLYQQLKCPVCQGQSIAESNADVALQMREQVRKLLQKGLSDMEIRDTFAENMGENILLQPSLKLHSMALWLTPLIAIGIFSLFLGRRFRKNIL